MELFTRVQKQMGSVFTLGVVAADPAEARRLLDMGIAEIARIEWMLSEFLPESETSRINSSGTQAVAVSEECAALIQRCIHLSRLTRGDFDISIGPLKKLYRFRNEQFVMPDAAQIRQVLQTVGYTRINLQKNLFAFTQAGMQISFAAIGKGYAADRVKALWKKEGVHSGYINASGDLCAFGHKPDGSPWNIGIAHPDGPAKILFYIPLQEAAVATSGDYEQHFLWGGRRYSHNIDPHTGLPLSGIKSVSVFSPSAELSDALATAVYVKGVQKGLEFVDQLPHTHCIIIDEENTVHRSRQLQFAES